MTAPIDIEAIRSKPIYKLSLAELSCLPDGERTMAFGLLCDMKRDGRLAMFAANPPGTKYEVVADRDRGWVLQPLCTCPHEQPDFIAAYFEYQTPDVSGWLKGLGTW